MNTKVISKGLVGGFQLGSALVPVSDMDKYRLGDLGRCCGCNVFGATQIVLIPMQLPPHLHGSGWGCCRCSGDQMDNAIAVVCEPCFVLFRVLGLSIVQRFVYGELPSHDRLPISDLVQDGKPIAFDHISRYHIQGYGGLLGEGDFFLGTN